MSQIRVSVRLALFVGALLCLLACASAAQAGSPATVTVRVEGLTETKVPPTTLTTSTTPVVKDGVPADSCSGTSALGALDLATGGSWSGPWEAKYNQYSIYTIAGEIHEFDEKSTANYFWAFWLDNKEATVGACEAELQNGDEVLFFPSCYGTTCPTPAPTPLAIEAPPTANVGEKVPVTVKQYNPGGEASPAVGADIEGGGAGATTDGQGHATLTFTGHATYALRVRGAEGTPAIRTETTICVHNGNDGTCGTTLPGIAKSILNGGPEIVHLTTDVPAVSGVKNGHHYRRHKAPRILRGLVQVPAGGVLHDVLISLQRRNRGRCQAFSGASETFVHARCGVKRFFSVGAAESFSYLLPVALPSGHYVYDIEAIDGSGHPTKLVAGVSHVVFDVK
jgi:hypothetical protein